MNLKKSSCVSQGSRSDRAGSDSREARKGVLCDRRVSGLGVADNRVLGIRDAEREDLEMFANQPARHIDKDAQKSPTWEAGHGPRCPTHMAHFGT